MNLIAVYVLVIHFYNRHAHNKLIYVFLLDESKKITCFYCAN